MQRLLPPLLVLVLGITATVFHLVIQPPVIGAPVRWIGLPVAVAGLAMSVWGSRRFGAVGTNIKTFDQPDLLVSDGLFRWSRNPMYLGLLIVLAGVAMGLGSWVGAVSPAIFFLAADRWYIPFEEKQMQLTFREQYGNYSQVVRRWVGRRRRAAQ